jgi:hypothetical protein
VLELPFTTKEDESRGGDAPYDSIVNGVPYDIEDYWTQVYPELTGGQAWPPLGGIEAFSPDSAPMLFRGEGDVERQGAGFERVRAFREGVLNGAEACLEYQG